jgi:hypothetical protein
VSIFSGSLSYILLVGTILLGIEEFLRKRDDEFKDKRRMKGVFAGLILMGVLNLASLYHDNDEKERKEKKAEKDNAALQRNVAILQGKVDIATQAQNTAIQAQKDNTAQYLTKFGQLSDKVNELKTEVTTAELQKKLASVQTELQKTQKAMAPAPLAKLGLDLLPYRTMETTAERSNQLPLLLPVTDISLPLSADGSVHIDFAIRNLSSEVTALNVTGTVYICKGCQFAKEPQGLMKINGEDPTHRVFSAPQIHVYEHYPLSVDVIPPPSVTSFVIGCDYRCNNCVVDRSIYAGTIHLVRDFLRPLK